MPRGGARPGAGRKPKPKPKVAGFTDGSGQKTPDAPDGWPFGTEPPPAPPPPPPAEPRPHKDLSELTPLDFLLEVMRDDMEDKRLRIQAAQLAAPYVHTKKGDVGKKEQQKEAAGKVAGRFSAGAPPRLAAAGGKKLE
nr:hypothetical protein [uncultured Roseateles sp.]